MIIVEDFNNSGSLTALDFAEFMRDISEKFTPNYYLVQKHSTIYPKLMSSELFSSLMELLQYSDFGLTQVQKGIFLIQMLINAI